MKCKISACSKNVIHFKLLAENAIVPSECEIGELRSLFGYFQYRAPNIDSLHSQLLNLTKHNDILSEMIDKNRFEYEFCPENATINDKYEKLALEGSSICSWCKRFVCKRANQAKKDKTRKETDLECLLRHIRNSIAHGHVYVIHGGSFITILFEDENDKGNESARIICRQSDLKKWRSILIKAVKDQGT